MSAVLATVVDTKALLETTAASLIAGIGVTLAFSVALHGSIRFIEERRDGHMLAAGFGLLVSIAGFAVCVAAIVFGLIVMTTK
jgi:hypothetical protein